MPRAYCQTMINSRERAIAAGGPPTARVLEYIGVIALAAVLVLGIAVAGWGTQLRTLTGQAICSITPQPDCPTPPGTP